MWETLTFISHHSEQRKYRTIDPLAEHLGDVGVLWLWVDEFKSFHFGLQSMSELFKQNSFCVSFFFFEIFSNVLTLKIYLWN